MSAAAEGPRAWLFLQGETIPAQLRERAVPAFHVPLLPEETASLLANDHFSELVPLDAQLWKLLARGYTLDTIASRLNVSSRTIERRVAELRNQFRVSSTSELATYLAAAGF